ncbi:hypothetical protein [Tanticharoenia sakaeratensis]|nr:hypothetical protein [Tanticharoenia sakaeratensis]
MRDFLGRSQPEGTILRHARTGPDELCVLIVRDGAFSRDFDRRCGRDVIARHRACIEPAEFSILDRNKKSLLTIICIEKMDDVVCVNLLVAGYRQVNITPAARIDVERYHSVAV